MHVPESKEAVYQHLHWLVVSLATWVTNKCLDHILLLNLKAIVTGLRYNCVTYILGAHPVYYAHIQVVHHTIIEAIMEVSTP